MTNIKTAKGPASNLWFNRPFIKGYCDIYWRMPPRDDLSKKTIRFIDPHNVYGESRTFLYELGRHYAIDARLLELPYLDEQLFRHHQSKVKRHLRIVTKWRNLPDDKRRVTDKKQFVKEYLDSYYWDELEEELYPTLPTRFIKDNIDSIKKFHMLRYFPIDTINIAALY